MEPGHTEDEHSLLGKATQALQRTDQACGLTSKAMSMWQENWGGLVMAKQTDHCSPETYILVIVNTEE